MSHNSIRTLLTDKDSIGQIRIRVELDEKWDLLEIAEEYASGSRTKLTKLGSVNLSSEEAKFVRDALSELLVDRRRL